MIRDYYGIYDSVAKCYVQIFSEKNDQTAARAFINVCKDKTTALGQSPEDYKLYKVANFDDESGAFHNVEPEKIVEGKAE